MKKHVKLMAVLSVAGFMAAAAPGLAAPGTAFAPLAASSGWVEENGSWKYYAVSYTHLLSQYISLFSLLLVLIPMTILYPFSHS